MNNLHRLAALLGAGCLLAGLPLSAAAEEDEDSEPEIPSYTFGDYEYTLLVNSEDETEHAACIVKWNGTDAELVIPDEVNGYEVVALGDYAFSGCTTLTRVTLPAGLVGLGSYSFAECVNLVAYEVPEDSVFFESKDGVLYAEDGKYLMRYPIGTRPETVEIPDGVEGIGNVAFACASLLQEVKLPSSLTTIGLSAFAECSRLQKISIPGNVKEIPDFAFNGCRSLTEMRLHDEISYIGAGAFAATGLTHFTIPSSCTSIGEQAFADTKLTEIIIPSTVQELGYSCFGWKVNNEGELRPDTEFTIRAPYNSAGQSYAIDEDNENAFRFVEIAEDKGLVETPVTTAAAPVEEKTGPGIGRIIGIAICSLAIVLILGYACLHGKKQDKPAEEPETPAEPAAPAEDEPASPAETEEETHDET